MQEAQELTLEDYELEIDEEAVATRSRNFKSYKSNHIYGVAVTAVKNVKSPWGTAQAELTIQACDSDGEPVGATYRQWMTYPFNSKGAETKMDAKAIQRFRDELGEILRVQNPEKFAFYGSIEGKGKAKKYFDKAGVLLTPEAKLIAQREGNQRIMVALQAAMKDPSFLIGPAGFATFVKFKRKSGKDGSKFQNFSKVPSPKLPLVTDLADFYEV